jgi:hypothetical protein
MFNFVCCPIFHIGSLIIGLFDDLGWCPILAQPWVTSDTNGFLKKNGTPDGKTNGLGFAISGLIIHTNFSGGKIHKKYFKLFFNLVLMLISVRSYPFLRYYTGPPACPILFCTLLVSTCKALLRETPRAATIGLFYKVLYVV